MDAASISRLIKRNLPEVDQGYGSVEEIGLDFLCWKMPVQKSHLSHDLPAGSGSVLLSGPVLMGAAETALYACVHAFYGPDVLVLTSTFQVVFLRPARAGDLTVLAKLLHKGGKSAALEARVFSGASEKPCALVTATYSVDAPSALNF